MTTNDGGPAFPSSVTFKDGGDQVTYEPGMSLRDWFAGHVMAGALADPSFDVPAEDVASLAYEVADAMLSAREASK